MPAFVEPLASLLHFQTLPQHYSGRAQTGLELDAGSTRPFLADLTKERAEELGQLKADSLPSWEIHLLLSSKVTTAPSSEDCPGGDVKISALQTCDSVAFSFSLFSQ